MCFNTVHWPACTFLAILPASGNFDLLTILYFLSPSLHVSFWKEQVLQVLTGPLHWHEECDANPSMWSWAGRIWSLGFLIVSRFLEIIEDWSQFVVCDIQILSSSLSDLVFPTLLRSAVHDKLTSFCGAETRTRLAPAFRSSRVQSPNITAGLCEEHERITLVPVGWLGGLCLGLDPAVSMPYDSGGCTITLSLSPLSFLSWT